METSEDDNQFLNTTNGNSSCDETIQFNSESFQMNFSPKLQI